VINFYPSQADWIISGIFPMNIRCPHCDKAYSLNPEKIPPTLAAAKCKACGNSMPLRPKASPKQESSRARKLPAETAGDLNKSTAMTKSCKIKCLYCDREYSLDHSKIPPGVSYLKCKSCGHRILLKQEDEKAAEITNDAYKITCLYCSKTYKINPIKIPEGLTATKCKSCGHAISLVPKTPTSLTSSKESDSTGAYLKSPALVILPQTAQLQTTTLLGRKSWMFAALFVLVVLGIGIFFTGSYYLHFIGGESTTRQAETAPAAFTDTKLPIPFMRVEINVPLARQTLEEHLPADMKKGDFARILSTLKSLKLSRVKLFAFQDSRNIILPVAVVYCSNPKSLQSCIKKTVIIQKKLKRMPDGSYRLKRGVIELNNESKFPIDLYRLQFWRGGAIIAPKSFLPELQNPEILQQTQVARMAASIKTPGDLAVVSFRVPQKFRKHWENRIYSLPGVNGNPQIADFANALQEILGDMTGSLENIEALAFGFHFNKEHQRNLRYAQVFRSRVDGAEIYQQLNSGNTKDFGGESILVDLLGVLENPQYKKIIRLDKNKLMVEFTWSETDDTVLFSELSEATIGQRYSQNNSATSGNSSFTPRHTKQ
jgi:predicted Zn finger-like uncharacterized protein